MGVHPPRRRSAEWGVGASGRSEGEQRGWRGVRKDETNTTWMAKEKENFQLEFPPGFEPGLLDSKSKVITNYTTGTRLQTVCQ